MRKRELSPSFWKDERVWKLSHEAKLFYVGLMQVADRDGRMVDKPFEIGVEAWPWAPGDAPKLLDEIVSVGLIGRYQVQDQRLLAFPLKAWRAHQRPHPKERASLLPRNPLETDAPEGAPQPGKGTPKGAPRSSPAGKRSSPAARDLLGPSGSSGSSETDQDLRDRSGPSGAEAPAGSGQLPLVDGDAKVEPKGRKPSPWQELWEETLRWDRIAQVAKTQGLKVDDPEFDLEAAEMEVAPQLLNTLLKKVADDLQREFGNGAEWSFEQKALAIELAWSGYLDGSFGASVDPPFALNAFASPKTSLPSYRRGKAGA